MRYRPLASLGIVVLALALAVSVSAQTRRFVARDPGVQPAPPGAGDPLPGLTAAELKLFKAGKAAFETPEGVGDGLGPRFNLDVCAGCHAQPATGGTSPFVNPEIATATAFGANNYIPYYVRLHGPAREARFPFFPDGTRDGGVHDLYTISGRVDRTGNASGCQLQQPDFAAQRAANNIIFRIPTPVFGLGLIEQIPDEAIVENMLGDGDGRKAQHGIAGKAQILIGLANANTDFTISRFGWKAQNKSGLVFAAEAYNVEMGITNELFQTEREEKPTCQFATIPNDVLNPAGTSAKTVLPDIDQFAFFMRTLAPLAPSSTRPGGAASIAAGRALFETVGCSLCHTPTLMTDNATIAALRNKPVNLFSDLLLHNMGPGLADNVLQGNATGDEFRSAPLWGLGQRIFLLHDGRTTDLLTAIYAHRSDAGTKPDDYAPNPEAITYPASQANQMIDAFSNLTEHNKQDLLNFLRSL